MYVSISMWRNVVVSLLYREKLNIPIKIRVRWVECKTWNGQNRCTQKTRQMLAGVLFNYEREKEESFVRTRKGHTRIEASCRYIAITR